MTSSPADQHPAANLSTTESSGDAGESVTGLAAEWDKRYASTAQMGSGRPNAVLVTKVSGLRPGRALEIGCGEGADAIWLAAQGWTVTALDAPQVALERAALQAREAAVHVEWVHAGLVDARLPSGGFDLVCAQ